MAMMLDVSHLGAPKVVALRHLLSVLLINIYFHEYSHNMAQFLFFQYEQSQGYVSTHNKKKKPHLDIVDHEALRSGWSRLCLIRFTCSLT